MSDKPKVNHILHLLLSVITGGLWIPMWLLIVVARDLRWADKKMAAALDKLLVRMKEKRARQKAHGHSN